MYLNTQLCICLFLSVLSPSWGCSKSLYDSALVAYVSACVDECLAVCTKKLLATFSIFVVMPQCPFKEEH